MRKGDWICTDEDENQWGREIGLGIFEFKQDVHLPNRPKKSYNSVINILDYKAREIEEAINSYGYTLLKDKPGKFRYIFEESTNPAFMVANMLFEQELLGNL